MAQWVTNKAAYSNEDPVLNLPGFVNNKSVKL